MDYVLAWLLQILQQCLLCQSGRSKHNGDEQTGDEVLV